MDHDLHRMRRNAVSGFFSKRSVKSLEPFIAETIEKLAGRLNGDQEKKGSNAGIVNLNYAYAAMTMDIISEYCFGESMNSLDREEYGKEWLDILHQGIQMRPFGRQFPTLINFMLDFPPSILERFGPAPVKMMNAFNRQLLHKVEDIMSSEDRGNSTSGLKRTVFHEIRDDLGGKLPDEEKHPVRLMADGSVFLGAGTETTARTMAVTTFYLLKHPDIGGRLMTELKSVLPKVSSTASLAQLEALPYFVGDILLYIRCELKLNTSDCRHQRRSSCSSRCKLTPTTNCYTRGPTI